MYNVLSDSGKRWQNEFLAKLSRRECFISFSWSVTYLVHLTTSLLTDFVTLLGMSVQNLLYFSCWCTHGALPIPSLSLHFPFHATTTFVLWKMLHYLPSSCHPVLCLHRSCHPYSYFTTNEYSFQGSIFVPCKFVDTGSTDNTMTKWIEKVGIIAGRSRLMNWGACGIYLMT